MRNAVLLGWGLVLVGSSLGYVADEPSDDELRKKPVTTTRGELGDLLRYWYRDRTAAGNVGDWYDNRDGGHSPLDLAPYPQLRQVRYSEGDRKARRDWALQTRVLPHVVFGNSSTSAPPTLGGSNVRRYYCSPRGLDLLAEHYLRNNLYVYPEHRDHDPGHNGVGDGYGDLYPTNTPYLITSQGSSGTDQPFLQAIPYTLAAFRPEVKKKLIETGLLMPTVQMILRSTNTHLKSRREYFTGKAHPSVFEGTWVAPLKMARLAHEIRLQYLPALVKLEVVEEEQAENGRDFFEPAGASERHSDTASVIARIWRGHQKTRKLVVSAEKSVDVNKSPLTFRWVVLRGDEKRVRIAPRDKDGRVAEITVEYHERRPVAPGSPLESNRVDIGVFADNRGHPSAPAFVTFYSLDSEARLYDDKGRTREVAHGMGFTELKITDDVKLLQALAKGGPAATLLGLTEAQRDELGKCAEAAAAGKRSIDEAEKPARKAEESWKKALDSPRPSLGTGATTFVRQALEKAMRGPDLWGRHRATWEELRRAAASPVRDRIDAARRKVSQLGLDAEAPGPTPFARAMLEEFHARALAELALPGLVTATFHANYVDPRLAGPKAWRDVYRYDGDRVAGWTRHYVGRDAASEFTAEGWLVTEKDAKGRPVRARTVVYRPAAKPGAATLEHQPGDEIITFAYEGGKRTIKSRERVGEGGAL